MSAMIKTLESNIVSIPRASHKSVLTVLNPIVKSVLSSNSASCLRHIHSHTMSVIPMVQIAEQNFLSNIIYGDYDNRRPGGRFLSSYCM